MYLQSVTIHSANGGKGEGVRKPCETAGNRNLQTRTYKQEIQLIQVARIGQADPIEKAVKGNGSGRI
jgi:hypothetical protein